MDISLVCRYFLHQDTIAHDGNGIADGQDLLQAVSDKDDRDSPGGHAADGIQQGFRLPLCQDCCRLIQNEEPQLILGELSGDLRKLFVTYGHTADDHMAVDRHAHFFNRFLSRLIHGLPVQGVQTVSKDLREEVPLFRFAVQDNVLFRLKARDQGKLLMYHADARLDGIKRGRKRDFLAVQKDLSPVTASLRNVCSTKEDLHQRGLAGAVFTDQSQDLTGFQLQIDICQHLIAEKVLFNIPHLQKRRFLFTHKSCLPVSSFYYYSSFYSSRGCVLRTKPAVHRFILQNNR